MRLACNDAVVTIYGVSIVVCWLGYINRFVSRRKVRCQVRKVSHAPTASDCLSTGNSSRAAMHASKQAWYSLSSLLLARGAGEVELSDMD